MAKESRPRYVNVDELQQQVSVEQVLGYYGVSVDELRHRVGQEIRSRCFLNCGKAHETGERSLSFKTDGKVAMFHCYEYRCPLPSRGGNLLALMDLLKLGENMGGKPRGERFKELRDDLLTIAGGGTPPAADSAPAAPAMPADQPEDAPVANLPLKDHEKEAARALVNLDEKFLIEPDERMNKHAASYLRKRPWMTPEVLRRWRVGYLPYDTGSDKSGGTMRGKIVYALQNENGDVLTWFGRDPEYAEKRQQWERTGRDPKKEPRKHHFVRGFHRSLELYGQHRLSDPEVRKRLDECGIVLVEGANDVIAAHEKLGIPALGVLSNHISDAQVRKVIAISEQIRNRAVTVMFDCDSEGEAGAKQALFALAQHVPVRVAWSMDGDGGQFRGREPENLTADDRHSIVCGMHTH